MAIKLQIRFLFLLTILILPATSASAQSWTKLEGGIYSDYGNGIETGKQNSLYTLGNYQLAFDTAAITGIGIVKYDTTGNLKWVWHPIHFGSGQAYGSDFVLDNSENSYITGMLLDSVQFGDSVYTMSPRSFEEFFVSKIDSAKNHIWTLRAKSLDTTLFQPNYSEGFSIEISRQNKLYVLAEITEPIIFGQDTIFPNVGTRSLLKLDTSGTSVWVRDCNCDFFDVDTAGNYYTASSNVLKKYDDAANLLWQRTFTSPVSQLDLNDWNIFYVMTDSTLHKINLNSGTDSWFIPIHTDQFPVITSDSSGKVIVAGKLIPQTPPPYYTGSYFEEYNSSGNFMGYFYWGNPLLLHGSIPRDIILKSNGSLFVVGDLQVTSSFPLTSDFAFGTDTFPNIGNFDTYTSKIRFENLLLNVNGNTEIENRSYLIYPNPANNSLFIKQTLNNSGNSEISLFDLSGRKILNTIASGKDAELDLSDLDSGIYLLRIENTSGIFATKIIKQ